MQAGLRKATRLEDVAPMGWEWSWGVTRGAQGLRKSRKLPRRDSGRGKETETKSSWGWEEAKAQAFEIAPPRGVWPGAEEPIGGCPQQWEGVASVGSDQGAYLD